MIGSSLGPSMGGKWRRAFQSKPLMLVLLGGTCLSPVGAAAQTTNWVGASRTYVEPSNWSAGVPSAASTAIFAGAPSTSVNGFVGSLEVGTWQFQAGAPAYTFTINSSFTFQGGGIVNNSSNAPTIVHGGVSFITFANSATAGNANVTNNSFIEFDDTSSAGTASITNNGAVTFAFNSTAGNATILNNGGGSLLSFTDSATAASATITTAGFAQTQFSSNSTAGNARLIATGGGLLAFRSLATAGSATITATDSFVTFEDNSTGGNAAITANGAGSVDFSGTTGPNGDNKVSAGSIAGSSTFFLGSNQLTVGNNNLSTNVSGTIEDGGSFGGSGASLVKTGTGTLALSGVNTYTGGTTVTGGLINFAAGNNLGTGAITLNGGGLQWAAGNTLDISARLAPLGAAGGTIDTNGNNVSFATGLSGSGGLVKAGAGTLTLLAANSYAGGTMVLGGTLAGTTATLQGNILNNAAVTFIGGGIYAGSMSGSGSLAKTGAGTLILSGTNGYSGGTTVSAGVLQGNTASLQGNILNNASVVFNQTGGGIYAGTMSGTGSLALTGNGLLNLTGNNTFTGGTTVSGGTLAVNGSLASGVTVGAAGTLGGNGTITGTVVNAGVLAPGNSIGTLTVNGSYTQAAGSTYQVEANAAGQADRINVTGAPGTATINGGTVQVLAQPGNYGRSTTYTILNATGGVSGTYAGVTSNFAFLTPSLAYDANNVFLTLAIAQNAFSFGGRTPNQKAVGISLDQSIATASGDFAAVLSVIAGLNSEDGPVVLDRISGQPYADFGTMNTNSSAMFMNALGQQMANARGAASAGQRQALAQACEIENCDAVGPLSAWVSALGGLGTVLGDANASHADLQLRRRRGRHRLSPRPALPGRHRRRLHPRHPVGEPLHGPGLVRQRQRRRLRHRSRKAVSTSMRWRATPTSTTSCSARS